MADNLTFAAGPVQTAPLQTGLLPWWITSWSTWLTILTAYAGVCSLLRFRFEKAMRVKFNYPDRASMARMTNDDAQAILQYIITREFPYMYKLALQFAIFKVSLPLT